MKVLEKAVNDEIKKCSPVVVNLYEPGDPALKKV
jgi:hypothetical protein